jgi:hypothetical protein
MPHSKHCSDAQIIDVYKQTGNIWKAAEILRLCGQSVQERLIRLGIKRKFPKWTQAEDTLLCEKYVIHRNSGTLRVLAKEMGRTIPLICRYAKRLGLTDRHATKPFLRVWKGMSEKDASKHFERFRKSSLGLGAYCLKNHFDDLGFSQTLKSYFPDEWDALIESKIPRQTLYRLGRHVEYTVRDALKKLNYFVLRSPRSGGPVDLVAIKISRTFLFNANVE